MIAIVAALMAGSAGAYLLTRTTTSGPMSVADFRCPGSLPYDFDPGPIDERTERAVADGQIVEIVLPGGGHVTTVTAVGFELWPLRGGPPEPHEGCPPQPSVRRLEAVGSGTLVIESRRFDV